MLMKWLRLVLAGKTTKQTSLTARPTLEALEDRALPTMGVATPYGPLAQSLANTIRGTGITIINTAYTGATAAAGVFTNAGSTINIKSGIVLDTGKISSIPGTFTTSTDVEGTVLGTPGNQQLDGILSANSQISRDASVLSINFVPQGPQITMSFVFATNEPIDTDTTFNDTFAAFLNGTNVALAPQFGTTPQINVTNLINSGQYYDNDPNNQPSSNVAPYAIHFDEFSTVLTFKANVVPGTTNQLNIVIADVGLNTSSSEDTEVMDSAVFIQANSFQVTARPVVTLPARYAYNPYTGLFAGYLTVTNLGSQAMQGTAIITFNSLPAGVTVANATGVNAKGQSYLILPSTDLLPGQSEKVAIQLSNPDHVNLAALFNIAMLNITL